MQVQFVPSDVEPKPQSLIVCAGTVTCSNVDQMASGFLLFKRLFSHNIHVEDDAEEKGWKEALQGILNRFYQGKEPMPSYVRIAKQDGYIGGIATVPQKLRKGLKLEQYSNDELKQAHIEQYKEAVRLAVLDAIKLNRPLHIQPLGIGVYGWEPEEAAQLFVKVLGEIDIENQLQITVPLFDSKANSNDQRFKEEFSRQAPWFLAQSSQSLPHDFILNASASQIINAVEKIYNALYDGQTSFFKGSKKKLNYDELVSYSNTNKDSRTAKAWELARQHYPNISADNQELFKSIHQYSYAHSSNFFSLFKQSKNFSSGYDHINEKISQAADDSRTGKIRNALALN